MAVAEGLKGMTDLLLAKGANINAKDIVGGTPLGWAESKGHKELPGFLRNRHI